MGRDDQHDCAERLHYSARVKNVLGPPGWALTTGAQTAGGPYNGVRRYSMQTRIAPMVSLLVLLGLLALGTNPSVAQDDPNAPADAPDATEEDVNKPDHDDTALKPVPNPAPKPDADAKPVEPDPRTDVLALLRTLSERGEVFARVSVSKAEAQQQIGRVMIFRSGAGAPRTPFTGDAFAWRGADGVVILHSVSDLPGFALYVAGEKVVAQTTQVGEPFDTNRLSAELAPLLDLDRLIRHVSTVKEWSVHKKGAGRTWSANLPKDVVDPTTANTPFAASVIRVEGKLTAGADGALAAIEITVVHNDPRKAMMGGAVIIMGPNGRPQIKPNKKKKHEDEDGTKTVYRLQFQRQGRATMKAREFKAKMAQALESVADDDG